MTETESPKPAPTRTATAMNGHTMVYPLSHVSESGEPVYSQHNAWCADTCRACADRETRPDW